MESKSVKREIDVLSVRLSSETKSKLAHYAKMGWPVTDKIELKFSASPDVLTKPILALCNGADCLGFISLSSLQQFARRKLTNEGGVSMATYTLHKSFLTASAELVAIPVAAAAAAAASRSTSRGLDADGDVAMAPAAAPAPPAAAAKPVKQVVRAAMTRAIHQRFNLYKSKPVMYSKHDFTLAVYQDALRLRLKLLLVAEKPSLFYNAAPDAFTDAELSILYLSDEAAVNSDNLMMLLIRFAMHGRPQFTLDSWFRAELALLKLRIELASRLEGGAKFAGRFVRHVLPGGRPLNAHEVRYMDEQRRCDPDVAWSIGAKWTDSWIAVPFENALPLVRNRKVFLVEGAALFPCGGEKEIQRLAADRLDKEVLRVRFHDSQVPTDIRIRRINVEFLRNFNRAFQVTAPILSKLARAAAWGEPPKTLNDLQSENLGAPKCIAELVRDMAERKKPRGYHMKHSARLAFGWYIRARGFTEMSAGVSELLRGVMFPDADDWKTGVRPDIFPEPSKDKNNYDTSCVAMQKGGHCPFMKEGVFPDQARGLCAASVKLTSKVLRKPIDYTDAYFALHGPLQKAEEKKAQAV